MRHQNSLWSILFLLGLVTFFCHQSHPVSAHEESLMDLEDDLDLDEGDDVAAGDLMGDLHDNDEMEEMEVPAVEKPTEAPVKVQTVPYSKPSSEGLEFAETFDGDVFSRWVKSANDRFTGDWDHALRAVEAIVGDKGLKVMNEARHHGISAKLPTAMKNNKDKTTVVSYEVKFEDNLNCGGAYLKLFSTSHLPSKGSNMAEFDNNTPYVVMFGPDRCGATNKVHLIIKQLNPISNEWVEHHLIEPPRVPFGTSTHVYSFVVKPDNTYEVLVDGKVEKSGDMTKDFDPAFTPAKEIDDPSDSKPEDWVDEEQIADPSAEKPEDWDEDAPRTIPDPEAIMPEGWLEDEAKMIRDPEAHQPESWDEEEDGEWTAPMIKNPLCASAPGCGEWVKPMIPNPEFKGKWNAPMIANPAFKGPWAPRKIENPDYFVSENPHALADFDAIGFELWTMQKGLIFDNILVGRALEPVKAFIAKTWNIRHEIESAQEKATTPKPSVPLTDDSMGTIEKVMTGAMLFASNYPLVFGVGCATIVLTFIISIIKMFKSTPTAPIAAAEKKVEKKKSVEKKESEKKDSEEEEQEEEESEEESDEKEGEELKEKKAAPQTRQRRAKKD